MRKTRRGLAALLLAFVTQAAPAETPAAQAQVLPAAPVRQSALNFAQLAPPPGNFALRGTQP